jgi:1-deoxy-D-xylulose-5-phosphate reductoisomerase
MKPAANQRRKLIVLGSTGSIGANTLEVVEHLNSLAIRDDSGKIDVVGLAAGRDSSRLIKQARRFKAKAVAIRDETQAATLRDALPGIMVFAGPDAAVKLVEELDATDVSAAIVGIAGLLPTLAAIRKGLTIGLANKETLVAGGAFVTPLVRRHGAKLIPVDSEHSAIFQCIHSQSRDMGPDAVKRIVLTASGGPFRAASKQVMMNATVEQALNHPTWNMGPKITIDSATMMNKALEIIEAHWLFDMTPEKIAVIIHPQSIVHSFVEFADHSILAQLGPPDMKTPIQYALVYPNRLKGCSRAMDWTTLNKLDFEQVDPDKFGSIRLAYEAIKAGGTAGAILNAANEAAVTAFFERKVRLGQIVELVEGALHATDIGPVQSLEDILEADRKAREFVVERLQTAAVGG